MPRNFEVDQVAHLVLQGASMRPRQMPRNFSGRVPRRGARSPCFNEAAADAAEFFRPISCGRPTRPSFNEAAADAAEF